MTNPSSGSKTWLMNRYWLTGVLLLSLMTLLLFANPQKARADTPVCGSITSNTTWDSSGNDYIVTCNVQIMSGVTLSIQPGTVVKFDPDTSLIVDGELIAMGATFTTNDPFPGPYDWDHILFNPSSVDAVLNQQGNYVSGSTIQDSIVEFGGGLSPIDGAIEIDTATPYIYNNIVRDNGVNGIYAVGISTSQPVIIKQNSVLDGSGGGIVLTSGLAISNTVSNNLGIGIKVMNGVLRGNTIAGNNNVGVDATGSTVTANTISGNNKGGIDASSSVLTDNLIDGNSASSYVGGGIKAEGNSTITGNTISNNSSTQNGGGVYMDGGTLSENTISGNSSTYSGGGVYARSANVLDNSITNNSAASGGGVYGDAAAIDGNDLSGNHATNEGGGIYIKNNFLVLNTGVTNNTLLENTSVKGGGVYAEKTTSEGEVRLVGNTIQNNQANLGAGIYGVDARILGNTVTDNNATESGGGIYIEGGVVENNTLTHNIVPSFGHGAGAFLSGAVEFTYNNVMTNTATSGTAGGISIDGQPSLLQYNNLHGNQPYDAEVVSSDSVAGALNFWGKSQCTVIGAQIYDGKDVPGRGDLTYAPSLYSPAALGQLISPTNLAITSQSETSVTLSWTATPALPNIGCREPGSSAPDKGYLVYYETGSACVFDGQGLPQGDSPIDAGEDTTLTLTGLSSFNDYHFVVSAYDYLSRESPSSNGIIKSSSGLQVFIPIITNEK